MPGNPPRPSALITGALKRPDKLDATNGSWPASVPVSGRLKPIRKPQEGDCACPYDLMLDGSACGARSSYLTPGREKPLCYR